MNRGFLFLILTTLCIATAVFFHGFWVRLGLIWVALACLYFGLGYISGYGEILLKSSQGRIPWFIKVFLLPILLSVYVYNAILRRADPNPPVQRIREGLYLGRRLFPTDVPLLEEEGIVAILDVTVEFDALGSSLMADRFDYLNLPVFDHSKPRLGQMIKAVRWLHEKRRHGKKVLVHCALGQGRSVTVLVGYLVFCERSRSVEEHLTDVKDVRTTAQPNRQQIKMLHRFRQSGITPEENHAILIFNPAAGTGDPAEDRRLIESCLQPFLRLRVVETKAGEDPGTLTRRLLKDQPDMVLASGGDGTLSAVAGALAGSGIPLGLIPRGTANALAHTLFRSPDAWNSVQKSCDRILRGITTEIDIIETDQGERMVLLAGIGLESRMVENADRKTKQQWGALAYLAGGWKALSENDPFSYELKLDGRKVQGEARSIVIANGAPPSSVLAQGGGEPDPADGLMDITVLNQQSTRGETLGALGELFIKGLKGAEKDVPNATPEEDAPFHHFRGSRVELKTEPPQKWVIDGEIGGETPSGFSVLPGSLRIFYDEALLSEKAAEASVSAQAAEDETSKS